MYVDIVISNVFNLIFFLSFFTCSNATEVAQWATPSCSRPQLATDDGIRYGRLN